MKRFLSFLLIFALLVMAVPPATFAEEERQSGLYTYRVRGNGTLTITKFDWYQNKGDIYIPNMIDGYTVTEIGAEAFSRGDEDLLCLNSTDPFSLHFGLIPQPVTLTLPDTITTIGNLAFFNTPIKSIIIPESVEQIGAGAFAGCVNIERFSVSASNSKPLPPFREIDIRCHDFRVTFCTTCYNAGIPPKTTQIWMGHADTKLVMDVYIFRFQYLRSTFL